MNADLRKGGSAAPRAMLNQAPQAHFFWHRARDCSIHLACFLTALFLASCATPKDVQHHVVISVKDQKLALLDHEKLVAIYPVSTSKYGLGDWRGGFCSPFGELEKAQKNGDGMPPGTVFKDSRRTGEIVLPHPPRR